MSLAHLHEIFHRDDNFLTLWIFHFHKTFALLLLTHQCLPSQFRFLSLLWLVCNFRISFRHIVWSFQITSFSVILFLNFGSLSCSTMATFWRNRPSSAMWLLENLTFLLYMLNILLHQTTFYIISFSRLVFLVRVRFDSQCRCLLRILKRFRFFPGTFTRRSLCERSHSIKISIWFNFPRNTI